jgi:hypothetical protein
LEMKGSDRISEKIGEQAVLAAGGGVAASKA